MKFFRYLLPLAILATSYQLNAREPRSQDGSRYNQEIDQEDTPALRAFVNTKREKELEQKDENLALSGDVRFEWRHLYEKDNGLRLRGREKNGHLVLDPASLLPISKNDFDCEFNLRLDYVKEKTWAAAHLQFDNSAGIDSEDYSPRQDREGWFGSGKSGGICLKKAYLGYNLFEDQYSRLDIEVGRRGNMYLVFDSRVQFLSRLDGILFKYERNWECIADFYVKLAGFVIDERINHFGVATEVGLLNIADTGFDFKYSFIDWEKQGHTRALVNYNIDNPDEGRLGRHAKAFRFKVSQFTGYYNFDKDLFGRSAKLYGAYVVNHGIKKASYDTFFKEIDPITGQVTLVPSKAHSKENKAWYIGFIFGKVAKKGDFSFEVQYQNVQALAVPCEDCAGIGRGNVFDTTFTKDRKGNTNYSGFKAELLYALTDELTIDIIGERSYQLVKRFGGSHHYSKFEVEAIYAF